jgi:hypothetical protein
MPVLSPQAYPTLSTQPAEPGNGPIALFQKELALFSADSFSLYPFHSIRTKSQSDGRIEIWRGALRFGGGHK